MIFKATFKEVLHSDISNSRFLIHSIIERYAYGSKNDKNKQLHGRLILNLVLLEKPVILNLVSNFKITYVNQRMME